VFFVCGRHVHFLGWTCLRDHPPPIPPFQCPYPDKKGTNLLPVNPASICILTKTRNWIVAELWGKNWDTDAHTHMTYQAPTPGLHSPTQLPVLQNSTDFLMLAQPWKFGVNCCSSGLNHPAACTQARVPLTFGHAHRPPLSPSLLKKSANRLNLSWISAGIFKILKEWPSKYLGGVSKKYPPQIPPPPPPSDRSTYSNRQLSTSGFQIYNFF